MAKLSADAAIWGGSLGGTLAAYSLARSGKNVLLFEETDWIGGQLTVQAVPPDEHMYIERTGCTSSYRQYRNKVREYYRTHPFIIDDLKTKEFFCPGGSSVSRIAHPPKLALKLLCEMLEPFIISGRLKIYYNCSLLSASTANDNISAITVLSGEEKYEVFATYFLDGSDEGELIFKSGCEYVTGAESREMTGEPSALSEYLPEDRQPVTWTLAFENRQKGDFVGEKPAEYEYFKSKTMPYDKWRVFSMYGPDSSTGKAKRFGMFGGETDENGIGLFGLFSYRRIVYSGHFKDNFAPYDITLLNWPQNDYFFGNTFDCAEAEENKLLAKQLTKCFFYWLQTEAPTKGGRGYPYFAPCGEVTGTADGATKKYYVRESRRIKAKFTVRENDVVPGGNPNFFDSVGVGSYPIDLHITTKTHTFFYKKSVPFTIPLGALLPVRIKNLIPACKNIGTTHLTGGCYRLHPVEWNIGESAGLLAAYSIDNGVELNEVRENPEILKNFQNFLTENGIQLYWDL